jgi:hypothetical protein
MAHRCKVEPFRVRRFDEINHCIVVRGVGFVAECLCGEKSSVFARHAAARAWAADHMKMGEHLGVASLDDGPGVNRGAGRADQDAADVA